MRVLFLHALKTIHEFDFDIFKGIDDLDLDVLEGIDQLDFAAIVIKSIYDADIYILKAIDDFDLDIFEGINDFDFAVERVSFAILGDRTVFGVNPDIGSACSKGEKEAEREGEKVLHKASGIFISQLRAMVQNYSPWQQRNLQKKDLRLMPANANQTENENKLHALPQLHFVTEYSLQSARTPDDHLWSQSKWLHR